MGGITFRLAAFDDYFELALDQGHRLGRGARRADVAKIVGGNVARLRASIG